MRCLVEIAQDGQRRLAQPDAARRQARHLPQPQPDPVRAGVITLEGAPAGELAYQAVGGRQWQPGTPAQLRQPQPWMVGAKRIEDGERAAGHGVVFH